MSGQEEFPPEMPPHIQMMELNEILVQRIESGLGRLKLLSAVTLIVAVLLLASYASQVILPFATGQTTVTVNLVDPSLLVFEGLLIALTVAWVYVGAVNFLWARRIGTRVRKLREQEDEMLKRIEG
ncbi:MAG: hypothetical protein OK449_10515 [Thaumarchaeota archaeon]|nr:hypothetical protein [Nitrososphaerota archaeon]